MIVVVFMVAMVIMVVVLGMWNVNVCGTRSARYIYGTEIRTSCEGGVDYGCWRLRRVNKY